MTPPVLQGIVVTKDKALVFLIKNILRMVWFPHASLKGILSRYHFEIREYN
jgi:hypothetical protein